MNVCPSWSPPIAASSVTIAPAPSAAATVVVIPGFLLALACGCFLRYGFIPITSGSSDGWWCVA